MSITAQLKAKGEQKVKSYRSDPHGWNLFIKEVLKVDLDDEQRDIVDGCQHNSMVSVASGTARGKDFTAACIAMAFMYLTPKWDPTKRNAQGYPEMIENTKVAMTAPTDRQVGNVMYPDISRHFKRAGILPGRLVGYDIRTEWEEWFLTGFKADQNNEEAWTGFHAVNTMFIVTEASGIPDTIFNAIEGNLQGNSRLLIIFNPNSSVGYAAESMKSDRFKHFRLDSLNAPNVKEKRMIIPGQVDWDWVDDKVKAWCQRITKEEFNRGEGDFEWEGELWRPNDLFRVKVRAMFPKVGDDELIPHEWIELAQERWKFWKENDFDIVDPLRLGADIAGMGRDSSVLCPRYGNWLPRFEQYHGGGKANHMEMVGRIKNRITNKRSKAFIDTIGEGAGVFSRLEELEIRNAYSCKNSSRADDVNGDPAKDITGQYEFVNMRAYLAWCVRDWLNPAFNDHACLPPDNELTQELTGTRYKFRSDGKIQLEPKEDIKKRLNRSPDKFDALSLTFYPVLDRPVQEDNIDDLFF